MTIGEQVYVRTVYGKTASGTVSQVDPDPELLVTKYTIGSKDGTITVQTPENIWPVHKPSINQGLSLLQHELYLWHLRLGHTT